MISSIPSSQCASPSSWFRRYPCCACSAEATTIKPTPFLWYDQQLFMSEQLHRVQSHRAVSLSSPSAERLRAWRLYFESALALVDVLDTELMRDAGIPLRWYDALVHLEETPAGLRMNELAERILYSKSGFTRVVDRMEGAGLVRRVHPDNDRRSILVNLTDKGRKAMENARRHHRKAIE